MLALRSYNKAYHTEQDQDDKVSNMSTCPFA